MTRYVSRWFLVVVWLTLSACAKAAAYPIKDSGAPASSDGAVTWLNNQQVLFSGQKKSDQRGNSIEDELYVWDMATGRLAPHQTLQGAAKVCVHRDFISYIRRKPGSEKEWLRVQGKVHGDQIVEELVVPLPNQYQINPFNCRYYDSSQQWVVKGRATTPLLDEHGYLDWGPLRSTGPSDDSHLTLYRPGASESVQLPIRRQGLTSNISYEPSRKIYLIASERYRDPTTDMVQQVGGSWPKGKPLPVWWLTPEGKITEVQIPYHPFMAGVSRGFLGVKTGIFVWSHALAVVGVPGDAGGYFVHDGTVQKLIAGLLPHPVVSPDGCKVAFVHDPYDTEFPKDRRTRITVKVIDLCEEGR